MKITVNYLNELSQQFQINSLDVFLVAIDWCNSIKPHQGATNFSKCLLHPLKILGEVKINNQHNSHYKPNVPTNCLLCEVKMGSYIPFQKYLIEAPVEQVYNLIPKI